jgi:hypothetical protein
MEPMRLRLVHLGLMFALAFAVAALGSATAAEPTQNQPTQGQAGYFWYGGPGFYRGRWNGGGFGPCWTQTPIGNVWNCGR